MPLCVGWPTSAFHPSHSSAGITLLLRDVVLRWPFSNHQVDPLGRDELLHRFDESLRTAADGIARTLRTS